MPAAEWGAALRDILHSPRHTEVVCLLVNVVVGADDVECPFLQMWHHEVDHLRGHPGAGCGLVLGEEDLGRVKGLALGLRLGLATSERDRRVDPTRDQQVGGELVALSSTELVLKTLCIRLDSGFGDVVGKVPRWHGDSLFAPGVDNDSGFTSCLHGGHKGLAAIDDPPHVDVADLHPVVPRSKRATLARDAPNACVEHDKGGHTSSKGRLAESAHRLHGCHVCFHSHHTLSSLRMDAGNCGLGSLELGGVDVGHNNRHSNLCKVQGSGAPDAT
mmetsp:Transcript_3143/g.6680  ORF Transcript_3143/g.6680 Transcript_3143/m.6680 type:complete len:274 (-) Transcript_3143:76-897(-)